MTATYDAVLFDLDGVLTSTAALHAGCWKRVFPLRLVPGGLCRARGRANCRARPRGRWQPRTRGR
jgi:hypothetical protein